MRQLLCGSQREKLPLPPKFVSAPQNWQFGELTNRVTFPQTPPFLDTSSIAEIIVLARIFAAGSSSKESKTHRKICNLSSGHTENWSVPPCRSRMHISGVYVCFTLPSLMLMNVQSIKRARSFYAVSCITSPGGKHRGLAGSVAVLISETLLMLESLYTTPVAMFHFYESEIEESRHPRFHLISNSHPHRSISVLFVNRVFCSLAHRQSVRTKFALLLIEVSPF